MAFEPRLTASYQSGDSITGTREGTAPASESLEGLSIAEMLDRQIPGGDSRI